MSKKEQKTIRVQLVRSLIGIPEKHKKVVRALGLRKINAFRIHKLEPAIEGMIKKVDYLLKIEREVK